MKKFLSLVLALVMTMSLVTIGAGAAEYKDLTDKSEIQYEEAVAVLNKLGIITGYEDGSFKPTGALTRGAAAKIIVSLMIGSEAASNLTVAAAPYSDVPVTNTFAGVISYCKTAGYINGYADGTFRPTAPLTGYAFSKMLLGAVGYDGKVEGFTGSGWTMNVAKLGNVAGLFDDFKDAFKGNDGLTREQACLLALNTLKATEVEYNGGTTVTAGDASVVVNPTRSYKLSNNNNINTNIGITYDSNGFISTKEQTLEFGEEHFPDLKLTEDGTAADDFGRPANEWSFKNITIGTYALTPDYTYTSRASGDTVADKVKNMGLNKLSMIHDGDKTDRADKVYVNGDTHHASKCVNDLPDYLANGRLVEVYLDNRNADEIAAVVVIDTFIMQVKKVTSSSVSLKDPHDSRVGLTLNEVKSDDDCYNDLKNLKADDYVLVTVANGDVQSVAIPQTVTGKLTAYTTGGASEYFTGVKNVTIAGTKYNLAYQADSKDGKLKSGTKLSSTNNSTAYLDTYGNVIYMTDVEAGADFFVFDETYSNVVDGKIVTYAQGWDLDGNAVSLNLGTTGNNQAWLRTAGAGAVFQYSTTTDHNGEYKLDGYLTKGGNRDGTGKTGVQSGTVTEAYMYLSSSSAGTTTTAKVVEKGDSKFDKTDRNALYYNGSVKFVFVGWDTDSHGARTTDVDSITVKEGVQEVLANYDEYMVAVTNDSGKNVKYVVIFNDNDVEASANVLYVKSASTTTYNGTKEVSTFDAYINGELKEGLTASKKINAGSFYTYTEKDGVYTLNEYTKANKDTSVMALKTFDFDDIYNNIESNNAYLLEDFDGVGTGITVNLYAKKANVIDCTKIFNIDSLEDMKTLQKAIEDPNEHVYDANHVEITDGSQVKIGLAIVYNGNPSSNNYGKVDTIYVRSLQTAAGVDLSKF